MAGPGDVPVRDWGAGHYERTAALLRPAAQVLVDAAALRPGERVLDLGSGTGSVALIAAQAGADVTAVEPSARLLGVAASAARERGLSLRCEIGEAARLPLADGSIDCVLSSFALIFAPDADRAVAEIARVLAGAGRVAFTAWLPGGAVGAMGAAAQELVQSVTGPPQRPTGYPWHDAPAVEDLFGRHGLRASVVGFDQIVFTAQSPQGYFDAEVTQHPMAVGAFAFLQQHGLADQAKETLLGVLTAHNEDPSGFRSTSRYAVYVARRVTGRTSRA